MVKKFILSALAIFLCISTAFAQVKLDYLTVDPIDANGLDKVYDFDLPQLAKAPKGYEPVFVEHYGRHGSRYAYSTSFYSSLKKALDTAAVKGVLTPFGRELSEKYMKNYSVYALRMGDLSQIGINQQKRIASIMYDNFPKAFPKGASILASASNSSRSMMSMTAFCLGLQVKAPYLDIVARSGNEFLPGTCPRDRHNPWPNKLAPRKMPFDESLDSFQDRKLDYRIILSKLFTDTDVACKGMNMRKLVRNMYVLIAGMNSIPAEERTDFTGLFTEEEFAKMWLVDNYQRYLEYFYYYEPCQQVIKDIVRDAEERLATKQRGATMRFGHDHVILPVFELMGIEGAENVPQTPDEVARNFQTWHSPMATNIQMVFYKKKGSAEVLFKLLRNGKEVRLAIPAVNWPYYSWNEYKQWLISKNIL